jgi:Anti-sigma-28 factor, FlgM
VPLRRPSLDPDQALPREIAPVCEILCHRLRHHGEDLFRAGKVFPMRRESGKLGTGPIKHCSDSVDNFTDDVRLEKIDRLRKSLAENTYHVSSEDLAQKIIDHIRRL